MFFVLLVFVLLFVVFNNGGEIVGEGKTGEFNADNLNYFFA